MRQGWTGGVELGPDGAGDTPNTEGGGCHNTRGVITTINTTGRGDTTNAGGGDTHTQKMPEGEIGAGLGQDSQSA